MQTQPNTQSGGSRPRAKIGVFCGASNGTNPAYVEAAQALGRALAEQDIDLSMLFTSANLFLLRKTIFANTTKLQFMAVAQSASWAKWQRLSVRSKDLQPSTA
jgi:hypothetical protein